MSVGVAVLASGSGTNLQALLDRFRNDDSVRIRLVISDRDAAGALRRAQDAGVRSVHVPVTGRADDVVAAELHDLLASEQIRLIALAGYLRLVPARVVERFAGRIINIHPALLPAFGGKGMYGERIHAAVLAAGCTVTGATVHYVNERFDEGAIIAQWPVPVLPRDSVESLAARVLRVEHRLYPACVAAVARRILTDAGEAPSNTGAAPVVEEFFRLSATDQEIESQMTALAGL